MTIISPSGELTSYCSTLKLDPVNFTDKSVSKYKPTYSFIIEN
jgi:hypothetical protein